MALWCAALAAATAVSAILLWPSPVDRPVYGDVLRAISWMKDRGLPGWVTYRAVEQVANVALFVVPGLVASLLLPRRLWWLAVALCVCFSVAMELAQLLLPARSASGDDITFNSMGAMIGVGTGALLRGHGAAVRRDPGTDRRATRQSSGFS